MENLNAIVKEYEAELSEKAGFPVRLYLSYASDDLTIRDIFMIVSKRLYINYANLLKPNRKKEWSEARHIACALCIRYVPGATKMAIARFLGQDHTSVLHAINKVKNLLSVNDYMLTSKYLDCEKEILIVKKQFHDADFIHKT